jgi:hypothetical protein
LEQHAHIQLMPLFWVPLVSPGGMADLWVVLVVGRPGEHLQQPGVQQTLQL